jgi:hypothetical protein
MNYIGIRAGLVLFSLLALMQGSAFAQKPAGSLNDPVEVIDDPMHSLRMQNATIRVYEANIPGNSVTFFHRHSLSGIGIDMTPVRLSVEKAGAGTHEETTKSGDFFPVKAATPYVHRISNLDHAPYRVIVAERLSHSPLGTGVSSLTGTTEFKLEVETDLVRAYRLTLRPGESAGIHTVSANTLVVAISGGLISVEEAGKPLTLQSVPPGELKWIDQSESLTYSNLGVADFVAAFFEWK